MRNQIHVGLIRDTLANSGFNFEMFLNFNRWDLLEESQVDMILRKAGLPNWKTINVFAPEIQALISAGKIDEFLSQQLARLSHDVQLQFKDRCIEATQLHKDLGIK